MKEKMFKKVENVAEYVREGIEEGKITVEEVAKVAKIKARQGTIGEEVVTVMANGLEETRNVVTADEKTGEPGWIVTNPNGEEYIVPDSTFKDKYRLNPENPEEYISKGKPTLAAKINEDIEFMAPWGEAMKIEAGGSLVLGGKDDIYGIQEREFNNTYAPTSKSKEQAEDEAKILLGMANLIDIAKLGAKIGMVPQEKTLPNGKVVKSLVWDQENLLKAVAEVKHMSSEGKPVVINGAAPAWLVSALTHMMHPCLVKVYVPQIGKSVDIPKLEHGKTNPDGEVAFKTTEKGDAVLVEYEMDLPEGFTTYDEANLPKVVVPEVSNGKAVYISGRGPNYLTTAIAEAYAHTNSSVSLFQPGIGYTCSITHSRAKRLGDLTKDPMGKEQIKEQLIEAKENKKEDKNVND